MNEQIAVGAALLIGGLAVGIRGVVAAWPVPARGRHRATGVLVPLDDLLGAPSATFAEVPVQGVLPQAWRPCPGSCGQETPSVLHADGSWQCSHCLTVGGGS